MPGHTHRQHPHPHARSEPADALPPHHGEQGHPRKREAGEDEVLSRDRRVVAIAGRREGVVTVEELASAGLGPNAIRRRVRRGWLTRLHRGIYLVGPLETPRSRILAAVLAAGEGAVAAGGAAVWLHGFGPPVRAPFDVVVVAGGRARRDGIRVHRTRELDPREITRRDGIPVTSAARTLLDLGRSDADLAARGYRTLRFTWWQLEEQPGFVVARIAAALALATLPRA